MTRPELRSIVLSVALVPWLLAGSVIADGSTSGPLKVFILAGQSNMQGHAHVRTFDAMRLDPETASILDEMQDAEGSPRVCERVWISSIGSADEEQVGRLAVGFGANQRGPRIGPEYTFGLFMQKHLDEPILIIKTAWGGKSLHTDFRPPGAGPEGSGAFYRQMIEHVRKVLADVGRVCPEHDPARGHELAGFVWFQGWNDMVDRNVYPDRGKPGGYDAYSRLLAQFIRDVRKDLDAPKMPFVIGVMGVGGPLDLYRPEQQRYKGIHGNFRKAMAAPAALPEFRGNVVAVPTAPYWDTEVTALRVREKELKPRRDEIDERMKAGTLSREAGRKALDDLYADAFDERELTLLKESTSNAEYHYLGSARIMAPIGKAFADAMVGVR